VHYFLLFFILARAQTKKKQALNQLSTAMGPTGIPVMIWSGGKPSRLGFGAVESQVPVGIWSGGKPSRLVERWKVGT